MRIEQTNLALAASHARTITRTTKTAITAWVDGPPRPAVTPAAVASLSSAAVAGATGAAATDAMCPTDGDPAETDPKLAALLALVERLLGHKVRRLSLDDVRRIAREGDAHEGRAAHHHGRGDAAAAAAAQAPARAGWGVDARTETTTADHETTAFAATGSVTTADGRTIAIDLSLVMDRTTVSSSSTRVLAGDAARKTDPLVLDLGGGPARLVGGTVAFDLNNDGTAEPMPLLAEGAAYLARDLNGNGTIDNGAELFGPVSGSGFGELAALDSDGNGWIDEGDAAFGSLLLWRPSADGTGTTTTAADAGVGALFTGSVATPFTQVGADGTTLGATAETGIWLSEAGDVRTIQHVDVVA
jgi:hypothetical protein